MKCNHCKKIIPQGEEIIIDKKEEKKHLHEECLTRLEKEEKEKTFQKEEETRKIIVKVGFGLAVSLLLIIGIYTLKNENSKFFLCLGIVALLVTGAFWITNSYLCLLGILFAPLLEFLLFRN